MVFDGHRRRGGGSCWACGGTRTGVLEGAAGRPPWLPGRRGGLPARWPRAYGHSPRWIGVLAGFGEYDDQCADGGFAALGDDDFGDGAGVKGFEFLGGLVGLDLGDHVAGFDGVSLLFEPARERAVGHGVRELGHGDFDGHGGPFRNVLFGCMKV